MTLRQKSDARRITQFLTDLKGAEWLGTARHWWPDYLFHFTDIQNAVSILKTGALLSRVEAQKLGLMGTDNASHEVIAQTNEHWLNYARLYFRPRTPTQYRNEGIRPSGQQTLDAHCPVPVYLAFNSFAILSRSDSLFSDGNLARVRVRVFDKASDLEYIPFESVYHDGRFEPHERDSIVFHRNAEVIVPTRLDLNALAMIVCRSQAEYETLLHRLPPPTLLRWGSRIGVAPGLNLFEKKWTFVERVEKNSSSIVFYFNRDSWAPGPFRIQCVIIDAHTLRPLDSWDLPNYSTTKPLSLNLRTLGFPNNYYIRLLLDGNLAYADRYQDDLPW